MHCPLNRGNTHIELDLLRPFKASMSNILLLRSVKVQCLASCVFWVLVKKPAVLRESSPSTEWSRKKQYYWDKTSNFTQQINNMVESASQDFTDHTVLLLPHLLHLSQPLLLHWKIHPPWNPVILCISSVAAENSGTPQLTKMSLKLSALEALSLFFPQ